ncbi:alpha/beta fold hydrolase [Cellulomonas humilata]|uniref:Alpha/beta fold hydrolase n=1 Tax=Cellulomonas humilata TaxID=144055 RepID=A0A7Y6DZI2_9CELL|nr:alpha/beta hydrolase [Cellulomonas humilata]NUU19147.1 alpha/beta fold hydrolase [Cellulomonas humilata]
MTAVRLHVRRWGTLLAALSLVVTLGATGASAAPPSDRTSRTEAARVDRVPAPDPQWFDCSTAFGPRTQCGTVQLPLDYDQPRKATTEVALLKVPATDPSRKLGTLFLNPGGPGGSGVQIAAAAPFFLSPALLERFDVVGFDPRGTNYSSNVQCFRNLGEQANALGPLLTTPFPVGDAETGAYIASSKAFGIACSTTGTPLSGSMSTAEVARDMDVLRRTVGDQRLSYLGFSYGSYLGNVYANLFPDRVRAVVIDGVLDPVAWAGTPATAGIPQTQRLKSGEAASKALHEVLARCTAAGPEFCALAALGDPETVYADIIASLKAEPLTIVDETGEPVFVLTHATLISFLLGDLYAPEGYSYVDQDLTLVATLLAAGGTTATSAPLVEKYEALHATAQRSDAFGLGFPYDNSPEAFQSVLCTDGLNPARAERWVPAAARADAVAPGFGPLWTWASSPCASSTWTVRDEDAYAGPFTRRTAAPVLVVGNYWDPATSYDGAVAASSLLPNSRLLSSDSWGHTAYGTSACVTDAVDTYLLRARTPAPGTVCTGDVQPFTVPLGSAERRAAPERALPPVVPPLPGALPRS